MNRRDFLASTAVGAALGAKASILDAASLHEPGRGNPGRQATPRILIAGGGFGTDFIRYMGALTGQPRPRLCYLPTASADRESGIIRWYQSCAPLDVEPHHQNSFISSYRQDQSWEEVFLSMDGIVVSGGNTLNQQAIWRAQGIDRVLREAWDRGIVLGGASAGSLCWFEEGTTDSRPQELSKIECLGFLPGSHSPHYDAEAQRRPTYHRLIRTGVLKPGWACDNDAGILFEGTVATRFVSTRADAMVYYVDLVDGEVVEEAYTPERID
ncbi:MAG: peptidase E [Longimicrobiales bacterium]|nr:peptidase E [Longimicrobiales bacterium]